jgi:hypothetical protein
MRIQVFAKAGEPGRAGADVAGAVGLARFKACIADSLIVTKN